MKKKLILLYSGVMVSIHIMLLVRNVEVHSYARDQNDDNCVNDSQP